jgi:isopentenyl-diphosphate delta-isomerase type 1
MLDEMVILVDENDQAVGAAEKMQAHEQGLLHRAFSVFVVRKVENDYEVLLQQRNSAKYHCGTLWTNTCCSHPRMHESVMQAAQRRLEEEMGFSIELQLLNAFTYRAEFSNGLIEHEYDHVLVGYYNNENIQPDPNEVQDYAWCKIATLKQDIACRPEIYTPWLLPALEILQQHFETIT